MNRVKQIVPVSAATLSLSDFNYGIGFSDACIRFFNSAAFLPESRSLGLQINFDKSNIPNVTVFSDAELSIKDYTWIFKPCAKIDEKLNIEITKVIESNTYLISESNLPFQDKSFGEHYLMDELCELNAVLNLTVSSSNSSSAMVTLQTKHELSLRVQVMLSNAFHGAKIRKINTNIEETDAFLPCNVVIENLKKLLSAIADRYDTQNPPKIPELETDEEYLSLTPIDELDLSVRAYNCLKRAGINTVEKLQTTDEKELIQIRNLGRKAYEEILEKIEAYKLSQQIEPEIEVEDELSGQEMLDGLIGLSNVKAQVKRIMAFAKMQQDMKNKGLEIKPISLNMVFTGNPGTAKTTVARIMAKILFDIGILKKAQAIEVGRADLIGRYEGQTASNVKSFFEKAKGGILFIDEAYSLIEEWHNAYGDEAINTIVQEMENNRSNTVVVFAGYPEPMEEFLSRNPGLQSRVPFKINFPDYTIEEMIKISKIDAEKQGFTISPQAIDKMTEIFDKSQKNTENGNGRFCRNLIENAILSYAERIYGNTPNQPDADFILQDKDFSKVQYKKYEKNRTIGFSMTN